MVRCAPRLGRRFPAPHVQGGFKCVQCCEKVIALALSQRRGPRIDAVQYQMLSGLCCALQRKHSVQPMLATGILEYRRECVRIAKACCQLEYHQASTLEFAMPLLVRQPSLPQATVGLDRQRQSRGGRAGGSVVQSCVDLQRTPAFTCRPAARNVMSRKTVMPARQVQRLVRWRSRPGPGLHPCRDGTSPCRHNGRMTQCPNRPLFVCNYSRRSRCTWYRCCEFCGRPHGTNFRNQRSSRKPASKTLDRKSTRLNSNHSR